MAPLRELVFVSARRQNLYFDELTDALRHELAEVGLDTAVSVGELPAQREGSVSVLVGPHEFAALGPSGERLGSSRMRHSIAVCTEQPGTAWHERGARIAGLAGAALDINRRGVRALRRRGVRAGLLQLGYSESWRPPDPAPERDIDVCFLGGATARRERYLSSYAGELWRHHCHLRLGDNSRPNAAAGPSFTAGDHKLALLARSRVLINLHRDDRAYFEWQRVLEAIHCGAAFVSEHSTDFAPLVPGEHFLPGRPESLHLLSAELLADEPERAAMSARALEFIREELPMRAAAERLAETAERLLVQRRPRLPRLPVRIGPEAPELKLRSLLSFRRGPNPQNRELLATLKDTRLEMLELRRRLDELSARAEHAGALPEVEVIAESTAYAAAAPRVSVVVPSYNQSAHLLEALDSVASLRDAEVELIVVDDASDDGSLDLARGWIAEHDGLPAVVGRHPVNRGLPASRNTGVEIARGETILPLDSDNALYPSAVERLLGALDADPDAAFAYGILASFSERGPEGLEGYWGWEPKRLAEKNYIDALALVRRSVLEEFGGYTADRRLHGWEDYDLWCRIAARGMRGAHVPEIVARYRVREDSMISLTNISDVDARRALAERAPGLFAAATADR
ncbi:MAG: hypothetical protein QOD60_25 [Solirubrobacterales bacterium]|jgi:hypothetical protein|nr:hypothetical protein [Solirubrobacterales bacterium]